MYMNQFMRYWMPVVVFCAIIFVQSSFPIPETLPHFPYADKLMHFFAYGFLAALVTRAFNSHSRWRHRWDVLFLFSVTAATLYGLSDEWHQSFVSARTSDMGDVLADFVGSIAGSWIYIRILRYRFKNSMS